MQRFCALLLLLSVSGYKAQKTFYNTGTIQKIEVSFVDPEWDYMLDTAKLGSDSYIEAQWVRINGVQFNNVGVKYKGNSSYDSTFAKNPLHIELNTFKEQNYNNITDVKLSNGYADPSMVREVLAYDILKQYMRCPLSNFAQVYINGKYLGVYSNSEPVNKLFCNEQFYSDEGAFFKCNPNLKPTPNVKSNLKELSGDSSNYFNYYEIKSSYGWKKLAELCSTITNDPSKLESVINLDRMIWMLAFNILTVNLDSYSGAFAQNYYLYQDNSGLFNPIVWDLNMCFGGFPFLGNSNSSLSALNISGMQNLSPAAHSADPYWPVITAIQNNDTYRRMFNAHLKTILAENFSNGLYKSRYNAFKNIVDTAVLSDNNKFYSYNQFQNAMTANISVGSYSVPGIQTLMDARVTYLQNSAEFVKIAPVISNIKAGQPVVGQSISVSAEIIGGLTSTLAYRFSSADSFTTISMFDDGQHNDGIVADGIYGASFLMQSNNAQYYIYSENNDAGAFAPARAAHEYYTIDLFAKPAKGEVVINEFLGNNGSDVKNEFHSSEDWIELMNTTSSALSLSGFYLSDKSSKKTMYRFPLTTVIPANSFFTVWADEFIGKTQLHTGFKLDENGEEINFSDGRNSLDQVTFGPQQKDVSMARCPDGWGEFQENNLPSYGGSNCIVGINEENNKVITDLFPNPSSTSFIIKAKGERKVQVINLVGQIIFNSTFSEQTSINCETWPSGVYLVIINGQTEKLVVNH